MIYLAGMTAILLFFIFLPLGAFAATTDRIRVIDGDTIDISGERIRLHGIDTPEAKQTCQCDGVTWLCGLKATNALRKLIGGAHVTCSQRDKDHYGRIVAVSYNNGINLNAAMVLSGMALANKKYSDDYTGQEASAKAAGRGLWAGQFRTGGGASGCLLISMLTMTTLKAAGSRANSVRRVTAYTTCQEAVGTTGLS